MNSIYSQTLDDIISDTLGRQHKVHALRHLLDTLNRLKLIKLHNITFHRIESDEQWRDMGCPNAEYILDINYSSTNGILHRREILL